MLKKIWGIDMLLEKLFDDAWHYAGILGPSTNSRRGEALRRGGN
jgi:hypothetical protein